MRNRIALALFGVICAAGLGYLVFLAATDHRSVSATLGILPFNPVVKLAPGDQSCMGPVVQPAGANTLVIAPNARNRGSRIKLDVTIQHPTSASVHHIRSRNETAEWINGFPGPHLAIPIQPVDRDREITVCVVNRGNNRVALHGETGRVPLAQLQRNGEPLEPIDFALQFRAEPRSLLSELPVVFRRASLFKVGFLRPWMFWVLMGALLIAIAFIGWALKQAFRDE